MRICHVLETSGGGSGNVVLDLISEGLRRKDDLALVYSPLRAAPSFLESVAKLEGQIECVPISMHRSVGFNDIKSWARLACYFARAKPFDIVHSHSSKGGALARLARFATKGAAQIYTPHAFVTMDPKASVFYRIAEKALAWFADGIVCVSAAEKRHAETALHLPASKLFLVPNGRSIAPVMASVKQEARRRLGLAEASVIVGFVGRLVPQKNPLRLIRAFLAEAAGRADVHLVLLGDGPLLGEAKTLAAVSGFSWRIHFLGEAPSSLFLPAFDVLMCSSDYEALSLVFLEALAAGVPIVSTPVGGTDECVRPEETGFVASSFSDESLRAALARFLNLSVSDRARRSKMAQDLSGNFTVEAMAAHYRAVYETCLGRRSRS